MSDDAPSEYAADTRLVALSALANSLAGGMIAHGVLRFLVEAGVVPRESAIELVDGCTLKLEELRISLPTYSADVALKNLGILLEQLRQPAPPVDSGQG